MSPYTLFPAFSFLERVYKDGFRILVYKVVKNNHRNFAHNLFPYEAIYEEDSYVKFRTTQNPSNYVLYYDTKYLNDPEYLVRRNSTLNNNNSLVRCRVYQYNIDDIKMDLLKANHFDIRQINCSIDDLWIGVYFDRNEDYIKYELCKKAPNGFVVRAANNIITKKEDTKYMYVKEVNKFAVQLDYVDAFECFKYKTDTIEYMELKKGINRLPIKKGKDWICDDKKAFAELSKYGVPIEFIYNSLMVDNMVYIVEDIFRSRKDNIVVGPVYKTFLD